MEPFTILFFPKAVAMVLALIPLPIPKSKILPTKLLPQALQK